MSISTPLAGDAAGVGDQPVTDVDHRGGPERRGLRPGLVPRAGPPVRGHQRPGLGQAGAEQRQASSRVPEYPGDGQHVARPRSGPRHRLAARQVPQGGDGEHDRVRTGHVPADDGRTGPPAFGRHAGDEVLRPGDRQVIRRGEAHQERDRDGAHRRHVSQVARRGLPADVGRPDQSRRKCRPSTSRSMVATTRPSGAASTAASSPIPTSACCPAAAGPLWPR